MATGAPRHGCSLGRRWVARGLGGLGCVLGVSLCSTHPAGQFAARFCCIKGAVSRGTPKPWGGGVQSDSARHPKNPLGVAHPPGTEAEVSPCPHACQAALGGGDRLHPCILQIQAQGCNEGLLIATKRGKMQRNCQELHGKTDTGRREQHCHRSTVAFTPPACCAPSWHSAQGDSERPRGHPSPKQN